MDADAEPVMRPRTDGAAPLRAGCSFRRGSDRLDIRPAVAWRERPLGSDVLVYLSLYDDEIDAREALFASRLKTRAPEEAAAFLELTDAVLCFSVAGDHWLARGGAATFPLYWRAGAGGLHLTTALPVDQTPTLSRSGVLASAAAASLHGSYEPNGFAETPLAGWRRVFRGGFMRFRDDAPVEERVIAGTDAEPAPSREVICRRIETAFAAYGQSQARVQKSLLEVSGGFDSTLAAAAPPRHEMHGVSAGFPYYEFRFEAGVQRAVAEALGVPRTELDGTGLFPYSPAHTPPLFDEPSVFVTGIRHAEVVARHAAALGAEKIYMGHGGDQCFATDLTQRESLVVNPPSRGPFRADAWRSVRRALEAIRASPYLDRQSGTFVYDARQDVWVKERFGPVIRTPFTDLAIFRSAQDWSRYCAAAGVRPDKSILAEALPGLLPPAVVNRKGKVAYDGVWMRAYRRQEDHLCATFERAAPMLEALGVSPSWLIARARALAAWKECSDREVLALYALSVWLQSWSLVRPSEIRWSA